MVGTAGAEPYPLAGRALLFEGGDLFRMECKRAVAAGSYKVEEGWLTLTVKQRTPWDLEAPDLKESLRYAFKVDGDLLTLRYSTGAAGQASDLAPGEGRQVVVWRRQRANDATKPATGPANPIGP